MVKSANDNATYHLVELDGSRLAIPIVGKRVKIFKKRQDENPNLDDEKGGVKPTKPIYHRDRNLTLLLGMYQRTCGLVGVEVVKIFGNSVKVT